MKKFKNNYNAHEFPKQYEKNSGKSETIPDQTMTMREIMDRYAKGLPIGGQRQGTFDDSLDEDADDAFDMMPDMKKLDLSEQHDIMENSKKELSEINERMKNRKQPKKPENPPKTDNPPPPPPKDPPKQLEIPD